MARYYRRRTYTRVVRPKKKWGSNMVNIQMEVSNGTQLTTSGYHFATLAANKTETNAPTPVIVKTGNFKLQGDMYMSSATVGERTSVYLYIVYVPQGMQPANYETASNLINNHPEWIMAWRVLDSGFVPSGGSLDTNRFTLSSRLKRNLNSGDSIAALLIAENVAPSQSVSVEGKCQFWTCAN